MQGGVPFMGYQQSNSFPWREGREAREGGREGGREEGRKGGREEGRKGGREGRNERGREEEEREVAWGMRRRRREGG